MIKIKNTFVIILSLLLLLSFSCSQEESVVPQQDEKVDLKALEIKMQSFLANNRSLTSGRQAGDELDEIINDFLNDELQAQDITIVSNTNDFGATSSSGQNTYAMIYRFYRHDDHHFYTTSYAEGIDASYAFQGIIGMATLESNFASQALVRWYSHRNTDRVISSGVVNGSNHPAIALDAHNRWQPGGVYTPFVPFDGTNNGRSIIDPQYPPFNSGTWHFEGIMGFSGGSNNIYGYYNAARKDHYYTNNFSDLGTGANGYVYEGIAFTLH